MILIIAWWWGWVLAPPAPDRPSPTSYTVRPGDTLHRIAREHQVDLYRLAEVNGRIDQTLEVGAALKLP